MIPLAERSAARGTGPIPSLDGVRALAVLLVFFAHSSLDKIVPGGLGVTIFFVLSGYLISTLMRIEYARSGKLDIRGFYLRRLLRLMPPLVIVVALAALASTLSLIQGQFTPSGLFAALFYLGNYHVIANDFHGLPGGLGVVWSLMGFPLILQLPDPSPWLAWTSLFYPVYYSVASLVYDVRSRR